MLFSIYFDQPSCFLQPESLSIISLQQKILAPDNPDYARTNQRPVGINILGWEFKKIANFQIKMSRDFNLAKIIFSIQKLALITNFFWYGYLKMAE